MPGLRKVLVEGKGTSEPKPFHDDKAGAVGKAELLVGVAFEEFPSRTLILTRKPNNSSLFLAPKLVANIQSCPVIFAGKYQGNRLVNDKVGRYQTIPALHEVTSGFMVSVPLIGQSIPGTILSTNTTAPSGIMAQTCHTETRRGVRRRHQVLRSWRCR